MKPVFRNRFLAAAATAFGAFTVAVPADTVTVPLSPVADTRVFDADWGRDTNDGTGADIGVYQARDRSLLRFDLGALPTGSTLDAANLVLTVSGTFGGNPNGEAMNVYRLTQAWTEGGVTWNNYDGTNPWATAGGDYNGTVRASSTADVGAGQTITWDVTTLAQEWVANTYPNEGLIVINSGNTNGLHFASKENGNAAYRPYLAATITTPASPPVSSWTWNGGDGATGPVDGSGAWTDANKWWDGSAVATWVDGNDAIFGAGGTAGTVTVTGTVAPKSIWFQPTSSGSYAITGGTIDFGGTTRIVDASVDATIDSTIDNGTLLKQGSGKLILTGVNTYAGGTLIGSGVLQIGNGGVAGTLGAGTVNNDASVIFNRSDDLTVGNTILGVGSLTKDGAGLLELTSVNAYSGGTTVNDGVLLLAGNSGVGRISGTLTVNTGGTVETTGDGTGLGYVGQISAVNLNGGTLTTASTMHIWNISGGVNLAGGLLQSNDGISDPAGSFLEWGNTAVFATGDVTSTIAGRIRVRADNSPNLTFNVADGIQATDLLVSAAITQSGVANLTKSGLGTMSVTGATNYTGPTTVNEGVLSVGDGSNSTNLSDSAEVIVALDAQLDLNFTGTDVIGSLTLDGLDAGAGYLDASTHPDYLTGSGKLFVAGGFIDDNDGTWASTTDSYWELPDGWGSNTVASGYNQTATFDGATGTTVTLAGDIFIGALNFSGADYTLAGGSSLLTLDADSPTIFVDAGRTATIGTRLASFGGILKTGDGTLVITGNNETFEGITINGGTLVAERSVQDNGIHTLGTGPLIINNGGTLRSAVNWATSSEWNATSVGAITINQGGTWEIEALGQTVRNGLFLNGGTITATLSNADWGALHLKSGVTAGGGVTSTIDADTALSGTQTFIVESGSQLHYPGTIHNQIGTNSGITKEGEGTLVFTGAKTYTGPTTINFGTLQLGDGSTGGSLPGSAIVNNASLVLHPAVDVNLAEVALSISGTGSLTKTGSTILTITTPQTYTGDTIVDGGTLELQNNSASAILGTVANAGFETPDYTGGAWNYLGDDGIAAWSFSGGGIGSNGSPWLSIAPEGDQAAFIQINGNASQTISVPSDGDYVVSFQSANRPGYPATNLSVSIGATQAGSWTAAELGTGGTFVSRVSGPVFLTAGSHTLTFTGSTVSGDTGTAIDDVVVSSPTTNGSLSFLPEGNGVSNQITGSGTAVLNGQFNLDLSLADIADGNSWTLVNHATLNESYGANFSVTSNLGAFTNNSGTWTLV
ncbi:MAG: DNRLRE domain-containing protein, partial [Verrucomicrobiae bacterium]|nr:DNRLRE domain-containing protein [Verrucomicrobiae bacterium]